MSAQMVVQKRHSALLQWASRKSTRVAALLGLLLTASIVVNAMIILASSRP